MARGTTARIRRFSCVLQGFVGLRLLGNFRYTLTKLRVGGRFGTAGTRLRTVIFFFTIDVDRRRPHDLGYCAVPWRARTGIRIRFCRFGNLVVPSARLHRQEVVRIVRFKWFAEQTSCGLRR